MRFKLLLVAVAVLFHISLLPSHLFAIDVAFEMEVQERMFSAQVASVRENRGICSISEIPYWDNLAQEYMSHGLEKEAEDTYQRLIRTCIENKKIYHQNTIAAVRSLLRFYHFQSQPEKV